jgi:hypothetical protein
MTDAETAKLAQAAKTDSGIARELLRQHIEDCNARQQRIEAAMARLHERMDGSGRIIVASLVTALMTLLASVFQLALHGVRIP